MKRAIMSFVAVVMLTASVKAQVSETMMVPAPTAADVPFGCPIPATAVVPDEPKHIWSVKPDLSLDIYTSGLYDLQGKSWLAGYEKDLAHLMRDNKVIVYLAAAHMFDTGHEGKGAVGMSLGFNTGTLGEKLDDLVNKLFPSSKGRLGIMGTLSNYVSVEASSGYRFSRAEGQAPWMYAIGGRIKVPLGSMTK